MTGFQETLALLKLLKFLMIYVAPGVIAVSLLRDLVKFTLVWIVAKFTFAWIGERISNLLPGWLTKR